MSNLFVTTDEGSNVCCLGVKNYMPCMYHIGATIANRATRPYKISDLSSQMEEACAEVEVSLHLMEKWSQVEFRQNEELRNAASKALKSPAETRWLSYFNMVEALCNNIDVFEAAVNRICPEYEPALALLEIAKKPFFRDYLTVLRLISRMVDAFQSETSVTASWILLHSASCGFPCSNILVLVSIQH
uniref:Uncharacterized protein n=1 Tax=Ditylenchus dipsaci TaxID=166011 RepID=A0A915CP10_9BILA